MKTKRNIQSVLLTVWLVALVALALPACGLFSADEQGGKGETSQSSPAAGSGTYPTFLSVAEGQAEISPSPSTTFPIVIDQPGHYILTDNINLNADAGTSSYLLKANAIEIRASDVTLDLNGHTISGPQSAGSGIGILVSQGENVEIINGTVRGFFSGIKLSGRNHQIKNVRVCSNSSYGLEAESSLIINCQAEFNGSDGFLATSSTIINSKARSNGSSGLRVSSSTVSGCIAESNSAHGIWTIDKCRIEGNRMRNNGGYGLYLNPDYSYAIRNRAGSNAAGNFYQAGNNYLPVSGDEANREE
ncbi:MAG: right-handed parallel beta-helix repeat-containing protein [bacterium]|nr:right-handed parallel beta-helix repeat-containing protein [bacterium]